MARRRGWRRKGRKGRFSYQDSRGKRITDPAKLARIEELVIPPAWKDVWISPRATAKLQATGLDRAGRRQYLYHPEYRARQEQEKFDKLVRFAERLPDLRKQMAKHLDGEPFSPEWACALALRLINLGWFRVGTERYARTTRTFGITTLRKGHVSVRGSRITFKYRGKHRVLVRTAIVDAELADAMKKLLALPGGRQLFRYDVDGALCNLTGARLNDYIEEHMGDEFTAKDFRTWGGTLIAAIAFAEHGSPETETDARKVVTRSDARRRRKARKHSCRCAVVLCQSRGRRAVSRRQNDRRFQTSPFARCRRPRYGTRP